MKNIKTEEEKAREVVAKKIVKECRAYTKNERQKVCISLVSSAGNILAAPFIGMSIEEKPSVIKYIAGSVLLAFAAISSAFLGSSLLELKSKKEKFNKEEKPKFEEEKNLSI